MRRRFALKLPLALPALPAAAALPALVKPEEPTAKLIQWGHPLTPPPTPLTTINATSFIPEVWASEYHSHESSGYAISQMIQRKYHHAARYLGDTVRVVRPSNLTPTFEVVPGRSKVGQVYGMDVFLSETEEAVDALQGTIHEVTAQASDVVKELEVFMDRAAKLQDGGA